ncbi:nucleoside phosphorylase domain-containing protein [Aspergillus germanicus]
MPTHFDYRIGWICALPLELAVAEAIVDDLQDPLPNRVEDQNTYVLGRIGNQNIVIACLPAGVYGTTSVTSAALYMKTSFPSVRFCFMVGIAGGAPSHKTDIRLGDVVVSRPTPCYPGVMQYDYGKAVGGEFKVTGSLDKPPGDHHLHGSDIAKTHVDVCRIYGHRSDIFLSPGQDYDVLFEPTYDHVDRGQPQCDLDALSRQHGILCFEMEAAGLMDVLPCLVVRGISDYCDSHKNKKWQGYAAINAAAYSKELLSVKSFHEVAHTPAINPSASYLTGSHHPHLLRITCTLATNTYQTISQLRIYG